MGIGEPPVQNEQTPLLSETVTNGRRKYSDVTCDSCEASIAEAQDISPLGGGLSTSTSTTSLTTSSSSSRRPRIVVSRSDFIWILIGSLAPVFLVGCDGTVVATLQTPIGSYFNKAYLSDYLGTSYLLSVACFTPLYGRLTDMLGRRWSMLLAVGLFGLGTILCCVADSMYTLMVARAIAGMGGGGINTVSCIIITDLVPLKDRALYTGLDNIIFSVGAGLGAPVGGWFNDTFGWRWAFIVQVPIVVMAFGIIWLKVHIPLSQSMLATPLKERLRSIDYVGAFTLVAALVLLLLPISLQGSEGYPWSSPLVWGMLVASVGCWALFYLVEDRWSMYPFMPPKVLWKRTTFFYCIIAGLDLYIYHALLYNVPLYLSVIRDMNAAQVGARLLPTAIALCTGSLLVGVILRKTGKYWWFNIASALVCIPACLAIALWNESTHGMELWFDMVPMSYSTTAVMVIGFVATIATVSNEEMPLVTGVVYLFRSVGQVAGVSLSGSTLQGVFRKELAQRITGPGADKIIEKIRGSAEVIRTLEPVTRKAAYSSYMIALRWVFGTQVVIAFIVVLACLPIEEATLDEDDIPEPVGA